LLGLAFAALSALAADRPPGDQPAQPATPRAAAAARSDVAAAAPATFEALDADHDGSLARAEIPGTLDLARNYANYDLDGDGKLSRDEYARYRVWKLELARMQNAETQRR